MMSFTNLASEAACGQVPVPGDSPQTLRPGNLPSVVFAWATARECQVGVCPERMAASVCSYSGWPGNVA
jgi:hypothetical protein